MRLWTTEQSQCVRIFVGHFSDVDCLTFHPNNNYVASGSSDRSVRLWDARLKKACTATLVPSARSELARGKCGQWVGAACLTSDWVVRKYEFYVFTTGSCFVVAFCHKYK